MKKESRAVTTDRWLVVDIKPWLWEDTDNLLPEEDLMSMAVLVSIVMYI